MSAINDKLDKLNQITINAKDAFCLNIEYMGHKSRVLVEVSEFDLHLVNGQSRIKLVFSYMNANPIDGNFEVNVVEVPKIFSFE